MEKASGLTLRGVSLTLLMLATLMVPVRRTFAGTGRTLAQPADIDVFFLCYQASGVEPPFAALAALDAKVKGADEFKRAVVSEEVERQLRARAQSVKDVKFLQVNLGATLGEFDTKYNEYDFVGLGDGTYIPSGLPFGRQVRIALTNGGDAQAWKLDPKEAEAVLQRNRGSRSVMLVMKLEVVRAETPVDDVPLVLNAKILEYEVMGNDGKTRLGKITLAP